MKMTCNAPLFNPHSERRNHAESFKGGLPCMESPEVDHEHPCTGNHGLLADGFTAFDSLAKGVGGQRQLEFQV